MYNGIGLTTARGSGTSGYVQSNKFHRERSRLQRDDFHSQDLKTIHDREKKRRGDDVSKREGNRGILEHNEKRKIEVTLIAFRDKLEDDLGEGKEEDIERKVNEERARLTRKMKEDQERQSQREEEEENNRRGFKRKNFNRGGKEEETHEVAERQRRKMANLRQAFGISREDDERREGEAFDRELQREMREEKQRKRKDEILRREKEMAKRRKEEKKEEKRRRKERKKEEKVLRNGEKAKRGLPKLREKLDAVEREIEKRGGLMALKEKLEPNAKVEAKKKREGKEENEEEKHHSKKRKEEEYSDSEDGKNEKEGGKR